MTAAETSLLEWAIDELELARREILHGHIVNGLKILKGVRDALNGLGEE